MKIVSLLPSATEIISRLGLEKNLVGVSHECDFPESVVGLPKLTSSRISTELSSSNIHKSVMEVMKNAVSVYDLDLELLTSLNPDFIITQDLCDVCAVSFEQVEQACQEVLDKNTRIISLKPKMLGDIWDDVQNVANQLSVNAKGQEFHEEKELRIKAIQRRRKEETAPKVLISGGKFGFYYVQRRVGLRSLRNKAIRILGSSLRLLLTARLGQASGQFGPSQIRFSDQ